MVLTSHALQDPNGECALPFAVLCFLRRDVRILAEGPGARDCVRRSDWLRGRVPKLLDLAAPRVGLFPEPWHPWMSGTSGFNDIGKAWMCTRLLVTEFPCRSL